LTHGQLKSISGKLIFHAQPNTRNYRKAFPEVVFIQNKRSLNDKNKGLITTLKALPWLFTRGMACLVMYKSINGILKVQFILLSKKYE